MPSGDVEVIVTRKAEYMLFDLGLPYRVGGMTLQGFLVVLLPAYDAEALIALLSEEGFAATSLLG